MSTHSLRELIPFVRRNSPYYNELYIDVPDSVDHVSQLPIPRQAEFWSANTLTDNRLLTTALTEAVVFKTGGTTGRPKYAFYTRQEWREFVRTFGQGIVDAGLRPGQRVANLFYAGDLYASFLFIHEALECAPVDNVRLPLSGATPPESLVSTIRDFCVDVLAATSTTLCGLAEHLLSHDETLPDIELILFGGEVMFDDQRLLLQRAFPKAAIGSVGYASVDAGLLGRSIPGTDSRLHQAFAPHTIMEIVDPETHEPIRQTGQAGRLLVTNLTRRLMPILRYPVGDLAEWVNVDEGIFRILGRAEEGLRVGPVTLYTEDVLSLISMADTAGRVMGAQLVVRHWDGKDGLEIHIATLDGYDPDTLGSTILHAFDQGRPLYAECVRSAFIHPMRVSFTRYCDLAVNPRSGKLVRVIDERPSR